MKLYATTTSERASKGQGGNEKIEIEVCDELRRPIVSVSIDNTYLDDKPVMTIRNWIADKITKNVFKLPETKGKQKKDDWTNDSGFKDVFEPAETKKGNKQKDKDICEHCKSVVFSEYKGCYCLHCGGLMASRI